VMREDTMTQAEAWHVYDRWVRDARILLAEEHDTLERRFRSLTRSKQAAPKVWADAYLAAFADTNQFTLVTFDRGFYGKVSSLALLEE
jgi:predicted nucleic acid-binding protein